MTGKMIGKTKYAFLCAHLHNYEENLHLNEDFLHLSED